MTKKLQQLKAGTYWIGDPCYSLGNDEANFNWMEFVDATFENDPSGRLNEGMIEHQGIQFACFGTAYGDGRYDDQKGNSYPVDAGCISCVPVEKIPDSSHDGNIIKFDKDFTCEYDEGVIRFGHIEIDTGDQYDPDEYDEYDEYYEENY